MIFAGMLAVGDHNSIAVIYDLPTIYIYICMYKYIYIYVYTHMKPPENLFYMIYPPENEHRPLHIMANRGWKIRVR